MAQYNLGCCYVNGDGVAKDITKAVELFRKAAEQGNGMAQYNLGCCYANGSGVAKDKVEAVKWLRIAAKNDDEQVKQAANVMMGALQGK